MKNIKNLPKEKDQGLNAYTYTKNFCLSRYSSLACLVTRLLLVSLPVSKHKIMSAISDGFQRECKILLSTIFTIPPHPPTCSAFLLISSLKSTSVFTSPQSSQIKRLCVDALHSTLVSNNISQFSNDDYAVDTVNNICVNDKNFDETLSMMSSALEYGHEITFTPLYKFHSDPTLSMSALLSSIARSAQSKIEEFNILRPSLKEQARALEKSCAALRQKINSKNAKTASLSDSWSMLKELSTLESLYDEARLRTIPLDCRVKMVGRGFKVGVGACWLEEADCSFSCNIQRTDDTPQVTVTINGKVSSLSENIYLRQHSMPTLRLKSFSSSCSFASQVPLLFSPHAGWSVSKQSLQLTLSDLKSRIEMYGPTLQPPQSVIKFVCEQVIKILIVRNLEKFVPNEIGMYLVNVSTRMCENVLGGGVKIRGPSVGVLRASIEGGGEYSIKARELLGLELSQAVILTKFNSCFLRNCCVDGVGKEENAIDLETIVGIVRLAQRVARHDKYGKYFVEIFSMAYHNFVGSSDPSSDNFLDCNELFSKALMLAKNPIKVSVDVDQYDVNADVQALLKAMQHLITRLSYDNLGGKGVVVEEENGFAEGRGNENDVLLQEVKAAVNSVFIPIRRTLAVLSVNAKKIATDFGLNVTGDSEAEGALVNIRIANFQSLCTPSLPTSLVDFCTSQYTTKIHQAGPGLFKYEMVRMNVDDDDIFNSTKNNSEQNFLVSGTMENMESKLVVDTSLLPSLVDDFSTIGIVDIVGVKKIENQDDTDCKEETEARLLRDMRQLAETTKMHHAIQVLYNLGDLRARMFLPCLIREIIAGGEQLIDFGSLRNNNHKNIEEDDEISSNGNRKVCENATALSDLNSRFLSALELMILVAEKHTKRAEFKCSLAGKMSLQHEQGDRAKIILRASGDVGRGKSEDDDDDGTIREVQKPLSLVWDTSFVEVVDDVKLVIEKFKGSSNENAEEELLRHDSRKNKIRSKWRRRLSKWGGSDK